MPCQTCDTQRIGSWIRPRAALCAIILAAASAFALLPRCAHASEGGGTNMKVGAFPFAVGIMPAPGKSAFMGYFVWIHANSLRGDSGDTISGVDFRANVFGHAGRFVHTWDFTWRGFHFTTGATYLAAYAHTNFNGIHDDDADLSEVNLAPIITTGTFHFEKLGTLHALLGINYWYPIGHYEPRANRDLSLPGSTQFNPIGNPHFLANGAVHPHFATIIVNTGLTWRPIPKLEIDTSNYVGFNFTDHDTGYRSGDKFGTEWGVTTWPFASLPRLGVGGGGYYFYQFQDDHIDGKLYPSHKLIQIAIGPQAVYAFPSHIVIIGRWLHDVTTHNGANGDQFWMEFYIPVTL